MENMNRGRNLINEKKEEKEEKDTKTEYIYKSASIYAKITLKDAEALSDHAELYVKQKKIMVFRDLFSVMLTHWRLLPVWSPVLFCALRRFFSNRQPVLQQKRRPLPTGAMLPLKMNAFAHFVFKKDLI